MSSKKRWTDPERLEYWYDENTKNLARAEQAEEKLDCIQGVLEELQQRLLAFSDELKEFGETITYVMNPALKINADGMIVDAEDPDSFESSGGIRVHDENTKSD